MLDDHPAGFNAAHIQDVVDDSQQMLCRIPDPPQVFLHLFAGRRIVHGDIVQADNGVHGRPDFMAHIRQKSGFGLAGLFRGSQGRAQHFPVLRQLLRLQVLPFHRFLKLPAVFLFFVLNDKAVQHTRPQHIPHGVKRHQGIKNLNHNQQRHGDAEHADRQMAKPHASFGSGSNAQGVDRSHEKQQNLNTEGNKPEYFRVVSAGFVKPEQDRREKIDGNHHKLKGKESPSRLTEDLFKSAFSRQVGSNIHGPQHNCRRHGCEMDGRIRVQDCRHPPLVQDPPQQVRDIVSHNAQQKKAVIALVPAGVPAMPQDIPVRDKQNNQGQDPDNRIGHDSFLRIWKR